MAKYRIIHEREKCIGCGSCAAICPENWELKGEKSRPKKTILEEIGCNQEAADSCPVECIHVEKIE